MTQAEHDHMHRVRSIAFGADDGYSPEERMAFRWQYAKHLGNAWEEMFWKLVERSDEEHLEKLQEGFPLEIRTYWLFTRERGWAQALREKSGLGL